MSCVLPHARTCTSAHLEPHPCLTIPLPPNSASSDPPKPALPDPSSTHLYSQSPKFWIPCLTYLPSQLGTRRSPDPSSAALSNTAPPDHSSAPSALLCFIPGPPVPHPQSPEVCSPSPAQPQPCTPIPAPPFLLPPRTRRSRGPAAASRTSPGSRPRLRPPPELPLSRAARPGPCRPAPPRRVTGATAAPGPGRTHPGPLTRGSVGRAPLHVPRPRSPWGAGGRAGPGPLPLPPPQLPMAAAAPVGGGSEGGARGSGGGGRPGLQPRRLQGIPGSRVRAGGGRRQPHRLPGGSAEGPHPVERPPHQPGLAWLALPGGWGARPPAYSCTLMSTDETHSVLRTLLMLCQGLWGRLCCWDVVVGDTRQARSPQCPSPWTISQYLHRCWC